MKPTYQDIKAAAQYRWQEIHAAIGIDQRYLKNKHQPCPACGGKDRFRYDDKDGSGTFLFAAITTTARATVLAW